MGRTILPLQDARFDYGTMYNRAVSRLLDTDRIVLFVSASYWDLDAKASHVAAAVKDSQVVVISGCIKPFPEDFINQSFQLYTND
jgi:hypothetical protein